MFKNNLRDVFVVSVFVIMTVLFVFWGKVLMAQKPQPSVPAPPQAAGLIKREMFPIHCMRADLFRKQFADDGDVVTFTGVFGAGNAVVIFTSKDNSGKFFLTFFNPVRKIGCMVVIGAQAQIYTQGATGIRISAGI